MIWEPLNLSEVCPTVPAAAELTACSSFAYMYLNLLTSLYADSYDRRLQEEIDEHDSRCGTKSNNRKHCENTVEEYDFIVVGAGAAGCVVANRLTEIEEWKVLLLEAGPEQPDVTLPPGFANTLMGSNIDWQYKTMPNGKSCLARPNQQCDWPRGKMMGGSSSINSMAYIRGHRLDYDGWAELGNDGWSYDAILPYFRKSEKNVNVENANRKYHGVNGEQHVARYPYIDDPSVMMTNAFVENGLPLRDYNAEHQVGTMQAQAFQYGGIRASTNTAFIRNIRHERKNLTVKPNSEVFKVLIDENKVAYGVEYERHGRVYTATARKEVILSGGSINSPKLLMESGIGPKAHLEDIGIPVIQNLAVGKNLHDHVTFNGIVIALPNKTSTLVPHEQFLNEVKEYLNAEFPDGPLSSTGPCNSIAFIKTEPDLPAPDIQYQLDTCILNEYVNNPTDYERIPVLSKSYYDGMLPRTMNLVPKSRGYMLLNASNPHGPPLLFPNYFGDSSDFIPLVKGVKFLLELENTEAFKARGARFDRTPLEACKHLPWGTDKYIVCLAKSYTSSTYHPVGTCKMGPESDKDAVVDPRLKVYGIKGLRVIDASIMPFVIRGNTNAPSIMIGERGVAFVIEEWLRKSKCALSL